MKNQIEKKQNPIIFNFISWCICSIPIILIFSNAFADIIVVSVSLFFIYISIKENNWIWLNEFWIRVCFVIYFWLIISSFFAYNEDLALSRSISWIRFVIFAASLQFFFLDNKKFRNRMMIFIFIGIIYVNIEMFVEYFTGFSFYSKILEHQFGMWGFSGGGNRLSGPFKDAPKSGIYLVYFLFPALIGMAKLIKHRLSESFSLIFIFIFLSINIFLIYASGHRASMLSLFISLSLIIFYFCLKNKKLATVLMIILFSLGTLTYISDSSIFNKLKNRNLVIGKTLYDIEKLSNSSYGSLFKTSFKMFKAHPITGVGLKNYRVACEKDEFLSEGHSSSDYKVTPWDGYYDHEQKKYFEATCSSHPHNLYLTWLAETGIFGFLLFTIFLISISIKIIKYKKIVFDELIIFGILLSLIPRLIPMMPSLNFFSNWNAICFWLLIGWLLSFLPKESNKKKSIKNLSHF